MYQSTRCSNQKIIFTSITESIQNLARICFSSSHILPILIILSLSPLFPLLLKPNDPYRGRTAPLTSKIFILYIYSTNIVTEYFKHGIYSPIFSLQNAVCFIILTYLVPVLFTFYIQSVLKLKKNNSDAIRLMGFFSSCDASVLFRVMASPNVD